MIGQMIHDKLLTDFAALKFEDNSTLFRNVKKFYKARTMGARDCLIVPDSTPEETEGPQGGNYQTTRIYTFRAIYLETIESADNDEEGALKYSRLLNTTDSVLNYLQKEPSNLNSWGDSNGIAIYKIRVQSLRYTDQETKKGYATLGHVTFGVYLNVVPQNL